MRKHTKKQSTERLLYPVVFKMTETDYNRLLEFIDNRKEPCTISEFVREVIIEVVETGRYDVTNFQ